MHARDHERVVAEVSAKRKTIQVDALKAMANDMLARSADDMTDGRIAIAIFISDVLMTTGNYHGYNHLPGIVDFDVSPPVIVGDETRRVYH
jgi:hypothetical protein